jgi:predicted O-linked N-acetylglucosamine transferase (SPINDLY family)
MPLLSITDSVADPPEVTDRWYTEKLIRLSGSFLCYQPPNDAPEVSELPALHSNGITFASFNNRAKITETVIHTWAAILNQIPGARLILKSRALVDNETCQALVKQFEACHVNPEKLELIGFLPFKSHLALYHRVDVALDTFPYNGTTTTCEAFWMGVPVIVLEGSFHVSRVGVSLLTSVGLNGFIASSVDDYIQKAVTLSQDLGTLSTIRSNLRELMGNSQLMDAKTLTQSIEQVYEAIWTSCRNQYLKKIEHLSNFGGG